MQRLRPRTLLGTLASLMLIGSACDDGGSAQGSASTAGRAPANVLVQITSDPTGATVTVDGVRWGTTPATVQVPSGRPVPYRLVATEPYSNYNLYRPYAGTLEVSEATGISVWIDRTSAEEQQAQRDTAARAAAEREAARVAAEREACLRRVGSAELIIESWRWYESYSYAIVEGEVRNNTNATLRNVTAVVSFRTADGTFITSDDALIEYTTLLPNQRSPFKVYARWNPAMRTANVEFKRLLGGPVSAMTRAQASECR